MRQILFITLTASTLFVAIPASTQTKAGAPQAARAGVNGVGVPSCTYCPLPEYTKQARKAKLHGAVVVEAIVTTGGSAENISVIRGLGLGLDEKAIEVVKKWHFKPARDANDHPIAVSVPIEVSFRLP